MSGLPHLGWSEHVYPLEAGDLAALPDGVSLPEAALPCDPVLLYIRPDGPDALVRGRAQVAAAAAGDPRAVVPVRLVFKPAIAEWNLPATCVRVLRNRRRYQGTGVYHISVQAVRRMGLERARRTLEHPQRRGRTDRRAEMARLRESLLRDGYDDARPLIVMLCRTGGVEDSLQQGHHRVSACLACGVDRASVTFSAAGALPLGLRRAFGLCGGRPTLLARLARRLLRGHFFCRRQDIPGVQAHEH